MEEVKKIKITFEDGKTMTTYYGPGNRIGDSYWVTIFHHMRKYFCLINKNGKPITSLLTKELVSFFCTKDRNDIVLELKGQNETHSNFYHFQKKEKEYHCVFSTENKDQMFFEMKQTDNSDYCYLISANQKMALYSLKDAKQITPFFDELELVDEDSTHLAFFSEKIILEEDQEKFIATELVGFIGYQGEFSSRIYDTNSLIYHNEDQRYYIILQSGLEGIKKFQELCFRLTLAYQNYYSEVDRQNDEVISELFLEKIEVKDRPSYQNPAKIIPFPKR